MEGKERGGRGWGGGTDEKDVLLIGDAVEGNEDEHAHAIRLLAHPEAKEGG